MYRFHVVALPHTKTTKEYSACAYTQKVFNFCKMMMSLGHQVFHYGAEGSTPECTEHITVITSREQERFFKHNDWHKQVFSIKWDINEPYWRIMNGRTTAEVVVRLQKRDFLCLIGGACQKPIADAVGTSDAITVEFGVGYYGVFAQFKVFESYTHQSCVYGRMMQDPNGNLYDCVIPNYYDLDDFPFCATKENYLLYLGRVIQRKGIQIAVSTARATGLPLIIAGQGVLFCTPEKLLCVGPYAVDLKDANVTHVGYADVAKRATLLGRAQALISPTLFLEPFGGNVVEAQLCGTPVITTNHAAFSETVQHGVTGYRCHTLEQFVWAAQNVAKLDPQIIRDRAARMYSLDRVKYMYQEYFDMLSALWSQGWPELKDRTQLDWLTC